MNKKNVTVTMRLSEEQFALLKQMTQETRRSATSFLEEAIDNYHNPKKQPSFQSFNPRGNSSFSSC